MFLHRHQNAGQNQLLMRLRCSIFVLIIFDKREAVLLVVRTLVEK
jgi:hypothetical protein